MKASYSEGEDFIKRKQKLEDLRDLGIDPYPHSFSPTQTLSQLKEKYSASDLPGSEEAAEGKTPYVVIAGRICLFRAMGKNAFAHIQEQGERLQLMINRDRVTLTSYEGTDVSAAKVIEKKLDLGDWIGLKGHLFYTRRGELTLDVKELTILSKSLLPLPDKHAGLQDKELRYRKRWLDLIAHKEVRDTFVQRSQILSKIRDFFHEKDFLEVETPILQRLYGGAQARPFETLFHTLDQKMYMRISLELPLKQLIVGGMHRVFEMGKVFRNEGIDRQHNPEFTLLEAYASYWDYENLMDVLEELVETLVLALHNKKTFPFRKSEDAEIIEIDVSRPWKRMSMAESLLEYAELDVESLSDEELIEKLRAFCSPEELKGKSRGLLISALFEELVEDKLIQPHHITDHPKETSPLCKIHRDPQKKDLIERFESYIGGHELCNAYSELNDPIEQRKLLEEQASFKKAGDLEASPLDEDFIEAICQGMPPVAGIGIGIDRLVGLLTSSLSIRDVLYFPFLRS